MPLVPVHGGLSAPVDRILPLTEKKNLLEDARRLPRILVNDADLSTVYRIGDGTLSPQANSTKCFGRLLANRAVELGMTLPWADEEGKRGPPFVYLWDERLTSQAARVNIKTKAFLHSCKRVP